MYCEYPTMVIDNKKINLLKWFIIISGLSFVIALCTVLDSFYYQTVVFTPYNYCSVNFDMAHIICIFVSKSHDTIHY